MKAIITIGISASGKSTWASAQSGFTVICRDDIRRQILESKLDRELRPGELWSKWKWKDEDEVTQIAQIQIRDCAAKKKSIIIADTNLVEKYRTLTKTKLIELGYDVEMKLFPISFEEACKRDAARQDGVGHSVIMKQWMQYQRTFVLDVYAPDKTKPDAIMCDLDGTLAHMTDRSPFDWDRVDEDLLDYDVATFLRPYVKMGYKIIIMSGRDSVCREKTEQWLKKHQVWYDELHMRPAGDSRKDFDIKLQLFDEHVRYKYNVHFVIDDRPQVIRLWQALGIKTVTMGNPFIEF